MDEFVCDRGVVTVRDAAIGVVFVRFLLESVGKESELAWIQYLSPTYYDEPTPILIDRAYELLDVGILRLVFLVLVLVSQFLFGRRDI